jgi:hypothetical protein
MENNNSTPTPKVTKIDLDDMNGLITRAVIIANKENEFKFLKIENKINWDSLLKKYNLDPKASYDIDQANCLLIWKEGSK